MKKYLLSFMLLVSPFVVALAQSGTIKGKVTDEEKLSLPGATVIIEALGKATATDANGEFILTDVPQGAQSVKVRYIGYEASTQEVNVGSGITVVSFSLKSGVLVGSEVIILGDRLKGQAKALNDQRTNDNITNIVAADQIGRFPDSNIGDALKRVSGVTATYDQGEVRFGIIRGTEPRLNSVMVNGERIPSAEAEIRNVQLDLIPADMIQSIEVNKALLPDMDADAIGGAVNLITRAAPNGFRVSGTVSGGYNVLRQQGIYNGSFIIGGRVFNDKLGIIASGSYNDRNFGSDNAEGQWDYDKNGLPIITEWDVRRYDIQRTRRSVSLSLDYKINPANTITFRGIYNHRDDWENRFRLRYAIRTDEEDWDRTQPMEYRLTRQTKGGIGNDRVDNRRLEDQRTQSYGLSGDHLIANKIKLTWSGQYAKASEKRPNERYINFRNSGSDFTVDYSDTEAPMFTALDPDAILPSEFGLNAIEEQNQDQFEKDFNSRIDLQIPITTDKSNSFIKFGLRSRLKTKERNNDFFEHEDATGDLDDLSLVNSRDFSEDNYLAGNYRVGLFATPEFLGGLDFTNPTLFERELAYGEFVPGNFKASENIYAGYAMLRYEFNQKLSMIAGIRLENTDLEYTGFIFDEDNFDPDNIEKDTRTDNYLSVLPNLQFKYNLTDDKIFRFAVTSTLARPNYFDLVPYQIIVPEDEEISIGNPSLKPTKSLNLDAMYEQYFESVGLISGGVFYKRITDFIFSQSSEVVFQGSDYTQFQPVNGGSADLFGVEVAYQRQFSFLPGLGIYLNYNFTESSLKSANPDLASIDELPGTAKHNFNASLSYETKKLVLRVSLNHSGRFLDSEESDFTPGLERYYDRVWYLDANASYAITPQFRLFAEANNLTNQPLRYFAGNRSRTFQGEYYGARFNLGLKFDLFK
jgi:TonB-dependent receptor